MCSIFLCIYSLNGLKPSAVIYTPCNAGDAGDAATVFHDAQTEWLFSASDSAPRLPFAFPSASPNAEHTECDTGCGGGRGLVRPGRGVKAEKSHSVCASWIHGGGIASIASIERSVYDHSGLGPF